MKNKCAFPLYSILVYYPINALDDTTHTTYINSYMLRHRGFYACLGFYMKKFESWIIYRVIHKSLRDFLPLRYSSRDGHAEGEHVNRGRDTPGFCPTLQGLDISNRGDATDVNPANSKAQNAFLLPVHAMFRHDCTLAVKPASTPRHLVHKKKKKTWRDSLPIDMLLCAVSVLVVVQLSSEVPEGLLNYPVLYG